jgi:uncharacterized BrkB/YihY/UPF0761 family membrane protein
MAKGHRSELWVGRPRPLRSPALNTIGMCGRAALDAFYRFNRDDGWAIASHIALSVLMALFPFLIVVAAF